MGTELYKVTLPVADQQHCESAFGEFYGGPFTTEEDYHIVCFKTEPGRSNCEVRHSHLKTVYMEFTYMFLELVQIVIVSV